jgi:hypothetical protein
MKRHGVDPFSFVFGAIFVSVGGSFLAGSTIGRAWDGAWPVVAIIVGGALAVWACARALHQSRPDGADLTQPRSGST